MRQKIALGTMLAFAVAAQAEDGAERAAAEGQDRLTLQSTAVTGNKELPKVLYIVPWKKSEGLDEPDGLAMSLINEILAPVDRSEFRREITIHAQLTAAEKRAAQNSKPEDSEEE